MGGKNSSTDSRRPPLIKKLLSVELQERRDKGLCFNCDDKFEPWHICKRLFLIDTYSDDENGENSLEL